MKFKIEYHLLPELPKLGWLCSLNLNTGVVSAFHGTAVECFEDWMVEGVWDDQFENGGFHRSGNFYGSGIRIDDNRIYFVPSSAIVDRLFYCLNDKILLVSNSLVLLLAFTGAKLNPEHDYKEETQTISKGIKEYSKHYAIAQNEVSSFHQLYYENMIVYDDGRFQFEFRDLPREIQSYKEYFWLVKNALEAIHVNYQSKFRKMPMDAFVTLSTGYDSTAVAALVKDIGVKTCFCSKKSNSRLPAWMDPSKNNDDGHRTAAVLGLNVVYVDSQPSSVSADELYFLSASTERPEMALCSMAAHIEKNCKAAVVFTGYHGGRIWNIHGGVEYLNDEIRRKEVSTLGLSAIRLKSGFINAAIPFMQARNLKSLTRIGLSDEMKPWKVYTDYDRPVPRRIAEDAGVGRELFGIRKRAIVQYYELPVSQKLRARFYEFLKRNYNWSPFYVYWCANYVKIRYGFVRTLRSIADFCRLPRKLRPKLREKSFGRGGNRDLHYLLYLWSVSELSRKFSNTFHRGS